MLTKIKAKPVRPQMIKQAPSLAEQPRLTLAESIPGRPAAHVWSATAQKDWQNEIESHWLAAYGTVWLNGTPATMLPDDLRDLQDLHARLFSRSCPHPPALLWRPAEKRY